MQLLWAQNVGSKLSEAERSCSFRCCKFSSRPAREAARCKTGHVGVIPFLEPLAKDKKSNLDGNRREITSLDRVGGTASRPHPTLSAAVRLKGPKERVDDDEVTKLRPRHRRLRVH